MVSPTLDAPGLLTVSEAARRAGCSAQKITALYDRALIEGVMSPYGRLIDAASLDQFLAGPPLRRGRPPGKRARDEQR